MTSMISLTRHHISQKSSVLVGLSCFLKNSMAADSIREQLTFLLTC